MKIIFKEESYKIMGACFEVYNNMGCGFLEAVYQECLEMELSAQQIPFQAHVPLKLHYKQHPLKKGYKPDFICYDKIIVEIKALSELRNGDRAQMHNYLTATKFKLGLLINFGHYPKLEYERIVK